MKKSLLLYLFILSALFALFTYMYSSKELTFEQNKFTNQSKKLKDSLNSIADRKSVV